MSDQLYDLYMDYTNPTELWNALERKYAVSEGGRLLYTCEQFYDFSVDAAKSIVAQAHEMLLLVGEIASLGCPLPEGLWQRALLPNSLLLGGILPQP